MKQIINVTDITGFLYCPRKIWLKLIKKLKEPMNLKMALGSLKHRVFDLFNKNEQAIVSSISSQLNKKEIINLYETNLKKIILEVFSSYTNLVSSFSIEPEEFFSQLMELMKREIELRADAVEKTIKQGFFGRELWHKLEPKYLTEFEIISKELGIKGRIDRVKFSSEIIPYELKTREEIFDADKLQLAAYVLLLEEMFNRRLNKGIIETRKKREEIPIREDMKKKVLEIAEEIRNLNEPAIQSNFKKCNSCGLKEECFQLDYSERHKSFPK